MPGKPLVDVARVEVDERPAPFDSHIEVHALRVVAAAGEAVVGDAPPLFEGELLVDDL
ncbi:MAG: hypothetical protein WEB00_09195 [Dehalococcoidia bacterium]